MHKTLPRVSIVVPAYNEEANIRACLEAIAGQSVRPYEVIVVDNNCTDNTVAIAQEFSFVTVVPAIRQGIVFARNAGFDAARGDIIGRIDADILMPDDWVARVSYFYARAGHEDLALTGMGVYNNIPLPEAGGRIFEATFHINRVLTGTYPLWGSSMACTRKQWLAVRQCVHNRTDIHEDLDLALHLRETGYRVVYDPSLRVEAELRRVLTDRFKLWTYLQWYPRALRLHRVKAWPICWLGGVLGLYMLALIWVFVDSFFRAVRPFVYAPDRRS